MAQTGNQELTERFIQFYRNYYREEVGRLAQEYPNERRSLYVDYNDLFTFDRDLAEDYLAKPEQMREYAEEALRLYDLPADVSLGQAHVRIRGLPSEQTVDIRDLRVQDDHIGSLIAVQGIIRKATDVRPKVTEAAFECQRCGTMSYIPQSDGGFQEPHECQGCERQGPFSVNHDQSEFVDSQKLRVQESPEGLRGGETPQSIDVDIEDDVTGDVTAGDHVTVTGVLHIEQVTQGQEKTALFDLYMDGVTIEIEDEEFEDMDITDDDIAEIVELSNDPEIYEKMVGSIAPAIYGYEQEKLAMVLQLFSGVTKHLPDGSRIRGDLHLLLIGDPGTGKSQMISYVEQVAPRSVYTSGKGSSAAGLCVTGDTLIHTTDGFTPIRELAADQHPEPVDEETAAPMERDLYTYNRDDGTVETAESSHVWRMPEKPCRRVETAHGKEIEASTNTPLLVCGADGFEWKEISEIGAGDHVAVPSYTNVERTSPDPISFVEFTEEKLKPSDESATMLVDGLREEFGTLRDAAAALDLTEDFVYDSLRNRHLPQDRLDTVLDAIGAKREDIDIERAMLRHGGGVTIPERFDADLMYLVGLVFGDGDVMVSRRGGNRGQVRISNSDEELLREAAEIMAETFDKRPEIEYQDDRVPCIRLHSATVARFFSNLGVESPKDDIALDPRLTTAEHADAFLRGLFDADGSVCGRDDGGSSVQFSTVCSRLAEQVQLMLETYGVRSRTRDRDRRGTYERADGHEIESTSVQTHLAIYGTELDTFAEEIGFRSTTKSEALSEIVVDAPRRGERLPVGDALLRADGAGGPFYQNLNRGDNPSRARAREMLGDRDLGDVEPIVEEAVEADLVWDEVVAAEDTGEKEVFDLTVPETHNFLGNGLVTHNTAAAVRDDFGDGQQWTLEAGALVLADKGIAAIDELDKMDSGDRSAMHEGLEQQKISVSKAGINATLKSRCSLLGAANPKYGRFDQYEPIGEQIDLEPALISRFDLIFTVTDQPDPEHDSRLAEHILKTNYAGELHTQREQVPNSEYTAEEVENVTEEVAPDIDTELLRKYIAYAKRNVYPTMSDEAKEAIEEFYVDLRSKGADEDAPVPVTARKLEALVRLAEASARVRLSDTVEEQDAEKVIGVVRNSLEDIGVDPETGEFDATWSRRAPASPSATASRA
ncbi:LAGLIDADG family homing endonuclease [Halolamina rubra]|uniref:LAGLIDADG family homing endonuclease n=1 Tax=Halolamina rubra TaxID=1380430 RepID=UPI000A6C2A2A|nr:LAGLIDADG family homing endonuclease [Halolamina rubra]